MRLSRLILLSIALWITAGCERKPTTSSRGDSPAAEVPPAGPVVKDDETQDPGPIHFTDVTKETGVDFVHVSGDNAEKPFPAANGSGLAVVDYDLDGRLDLLFLSGTHFPIRDDSKLPRDRCYRNSGGWRFVEVTDQTGLGSPGYSAGAACGDFNSDGFPDVYVNCFGRNLLYLNQGDGTFSESARDAGVDDPSWGTSAAGLDFDGDGDLDLYVCNYGAWSWETNQFCGNREKNVRIFCSPRSIKPVRDQLYENLGDGRFRDALSSSGIGRESARGQGVIAADVDGDGLIDLYVSNDIHVNFLFRNAGGGRFEDLTDLSGAAFDYAGRLQAGMGLDVADVDRDGRVELFVTNYEDESNAYYKNLGNNLFQDASQSEGMAAHSVRWVGWGTRFADFDLDGWTDLVVTNGHTDDNLDQMGREGKFEQPPLLFHNQKGRLKPVGPSAGDYFRSVHPGRALCTADLDGDLDSDLVIGHQDRAPAILRNDSAVEPDRTILVLEFIGRQSNRDGIGTEVEAVAASPRVADQIKSGGSYLSAQPGVAVLVLPAAGGAQLRIRWPDGSSENVLAPSESGRYTVVEGDGILYSSFQQAAGSVGENARHAGITSTGRHVE